MTERIRPTRSGLFAIELLIAVGIFTLCAAICVGLFVRAEVLSRESEELTHAVNSAKNIAEVYKASEGELEKTAELLGEGNAAGTLVTDKGESGIMLSLEDEGGIRYELTPDGPFVLSENGGSAENVENASGQAAERGVLYARLTAINEEGEELLSWRIAALSGEEAEGNAEAGADAETGEEIYETEEPYFIFTEEVQP